jgi:hypothetical protein
LWKAFGGFGRLGITILVSGNLDVWHVTRDAFGGIRAYSFVPADRAMLYQLHQLTLPNPSSTNWLAD